MLTHKLQKQDSREGENAGLEARLPHFKFQFGTWHPCNLNEVIESPQCPPPVAWGQLQYITNRVIYEDLII